jgi:CRISPR/Cas system-associated exonuclease Cas4 (RecB family)
MIAPEETEKISPETIAGCFGDYPKATYGNHCKSCEMKKLCKATTERRQ